MGCSGVGSRVGFMLCLKTPLRSLQDNAIIAVQGMTSAWEEAWSEPCDVFSSTHQNPNGTQQKGRIWTDLNWEIIDGDLAQKVVFFRLGAERIRFREQGFFEWKTSTKKKGFRMFLLCKGRLRWKITG